MNTDKNEIDIDQKGINLESESSFGYSPDSYMLQNDVFASPAKEA
jgi:hypothetical protein